MHRARLLLLLLVATASVTSTAPLSSASQHAATACNLRGSWVASNAETNRYLAAIQPTTSNIRATSGALTATFGRETLTVGSIGLQLTGTKLGARLVQEVDISAVAPYEVRGSRLALGKGTYKLVYVRSVLTLANGVVVKTPPPNQRRATPPSTVPYSCTPRELRLRVEAGANDVTITFRRERR